LKPHDDIKAAFLRLIFAIGLATLCAQAPAQDAPVVNRVKQMLQQGKVSVGALVQMPSPPIVSLLAGSGFDWLLIDMEHGAISIDTAQRMIDATKGTPTTPFVRITWNHHWLAKPVLDSGAMGVVTPTVNSKEEAIAAVAALRYPPEGVRGFGPAMAAARWGLTVPDYAKVANREILGILLIEDIAAVNNIEEILSVPGVDAVFVGLFDLSGSMGLLGQVTHPKVEEAAQKVLAAAKAAKVPVGTIALTPDDINRRISQGFQLIAVATDIQLLTSGAKNLLGQIKR